MRGQVDVRALRDHRERDPLEPTWCGYLTLEISNTTPLPARIYANEGIAQLLFLQGDREPRVAYADRKGKYQDQKGVTLPKL